MPGKKRVLVACEYSGRVRDAFLSKGVDAVSCDILPSDRPGPHIQKDILGVLGQEQWAMVIAFPPCTHLAVSEARWFKEKREDGRQADALRFVQAIWEVECEKVCIENPVGILNSYQRWPELSHISLELPVPQYVQPYWFGHQTQKKTGLWLRGLPPLRATSMQHGREQEVWLMGPSPERSKMRSLTPTGLAAAMAQQWSKNAR